MNNTMTNTEIREWLNSKKSTRISHTVKNYWWGQRVNNEYSDGSTYSVQTIFSQMDDKELNYKGAFGKLVKKYIINGNLVNVEIA